LLNMDTYKDYLNKLDKLDDYNNFLNVINKKDNLTNIKLYFNKHIFISIVDFKEGNYLLFNDLKSFKKYLTKNPHKKQNKNVIKQEKTYRIFLR